MKRIRKPKVQSDLLTELETDEKPNQKTGKNTLYFKKIVKS